MNFHILLLFLILPYLTNGDTCKTLSCGSTCKSGSDLECSYDSYCNKSTFITECSSWQNCPVGQYCGDDGKCLARVAMNATCTDSLECPHFSDCISPASGQPTICVPYYSQTLVGSKCSSFDNAWSTCAPNLFCSQVSGTCQIVPAQTSTTVNCVSASAGTSLCSELETCACYGNSTGVCMLKGNSGDSDCQAALKVLHGCEQSKGCYDSGIYTPKGCARQNCITEYCDMASKCTYGPDSEENNIACGRGNIQRCDGTRATNVPVLPPTTTSSSTTTASSTTTSGSTTTTGASSTTTTTTKPSSSTQTSTYSSSSTYSTSASSTTAGTTTSGTTATTATTSGATTSNPTTSSSTTTTSPSSTSSTSSTSTTTDRATGTDTQTGTTTDMGTTTLGLSPTLSAPITTVAILMTAILILL
ncbi:hypothetical protein DFA_07189 [Cavenderia fasciculata]|uniref:Uncharacterized protein n=1 Tax=Cavenderia fasciculata TaxID=261658 RepID=F4PVQ8_CACFS|nr:uncharacterized protein DFA_07189 [Cavenderia fasciculata]EGG20072.1 hypothetical protein DFA_07189 [Cavenderia fasciculata]|eukprot:XP_004367055.1 hypothetical protein DFA_07189 [Cavenderia fasciculata]